MKLLLVTQKVDKKDGYFGFFHDWLKLFAKYCDEVIVIALEKGVHDLPSNVRVLSLGKENGRSTLKYLYRFFLYTYKYRKDYTHVFCHMSPWYVIVGAPVWKLFKKPIGFWYVHRSVDFKLRVAEKLANVVYTSTRESFRINSRKINFVGQAVDLSKFARPNKEIGSDKMFNIVSVGRITQIKNLDTLILATKILKDKGYKILVKLVGAPVTSEDTGYEKKLYKMLDELGLEENVLFVGNVPNKDISKYYWGSDLSLNLCPTGGLDKAILESMASGTPAIVSNEALREYFGVYADRLIFKIRDEKSCASLIEDYIHAKDKEEIISYLLNRVEEKSSLDRLIKKIVAILNETSR